VFDRAQAIELRAKGMSWGQIAKKLGTTVTSVRRACHRHGPNRLTDI
jgi:transcriptional regulator